MQYILLLSGLQTVYTDTRDEEDAKSVMRLMAISRILELELSRIVE